MNDREHAREILHMGEKDHRAIEAMGQNEVFAAEVFGFHVQQAVEKALKAWIAAIGETYPFTHEIGVLLKTLERLGQPVGPYTPLSRYTDYAVVLRYSGLESADTPEDLDRPAAIAEARELVDHVRAIVSEAPDESE